MKKEDVKPGKKVWYYPILGEEEREAAVITSEPFVMCGTVCCNIDICTSVVDIENLEEKNDLYDLRDFIFRIIKNRERNNEKPHDDLFTVLGHVQILIEEKVI